MASPDHTAGGGEALPDWGSYTAEELREALEGLDRRRYPERVALIESHLERRRKSPPAESTSEPDYQRPPDWASYSCAELKQALEGLDRDRYPGRETTIRSWLKRREAADDEAG